MKILLITGLLAFLLLTLIISLDLILGTEPRSVIWKAMNPFRVMEPAEYVIVLLFILFFLLKILLTFLKKKKEENPSTN